MGKDNNKHVIKSLQSNILFVAAAELIIYNGGLLIKYLQLLNAVTNVGICRSGAWSK